MAEEQRMHVVQSVQRARAQTFDGPAYRPWEWPGHHSLPPAEVPQKKAVKAERARLPVSEQSTMERVIGPSGRAKWVLSSAVVAEVRARLIAGDSIKAISIATGVGLNAVNRIARELRAAATAVAAEKEKGTEVPLSVLPMPAKPHRTNPHPASPCLPCQAIVESKACETTITSKCGQHQAYQEPQRVHILVWEKRMDAYSFSDPPTGCLPKKGRKRVNGMTRHQMRDELRGHARPIPLAINCVAPGQPPTHASTGDPLKPLKTRYLNHKSAVGEAGKDVESSWRTACAA